MSGNSGYSQQYFLISGLQRDPSGHLPGTQSLYGRTLALIDFFILPPTYTLRPTHSYRPYDLGNLF